MKKSNLLLMIIIIVLIIVLSIWGFIKFEGGNPGNNTSPVKPTKVIVPKFQILYQLLDVCKTSGDENCKYKDAFYYRIDDLNKNPDLEPIVRKINNYYVNRQTEIVDSLNNSEECEEAAKTYKYRYYDKANIYYYVNDKMAVVTQYMETVDLCSNKKINPAFEVYYYDVEWQIFTDEDSLLKMINKSRNEIESKLIPALINNKVIKHKNEFTKLVKGNKVSYKLFFDMVGNLVAGYNDSRDDSYTSMLIYSSRELGLNVNHSE